MPDTLSPMLERLESISWVATLIEAGRSYSAGRGNRMAAAVAYRTIFAIAPLVLIVLAVFGWVVGSDQARESIVSTIEGFAGPQIASTIETLLISATATSGIAAIVGFALFFWTSSTLFQEVQNSLNDIFGVPYEATTGLAAFARRRVVGFAWALGLGVLMVGVWLLNATWEWVEDFLPGALGVVAGALTPLVSLVVFPFVFAISFRTLTRVRLHLRAVWFGGLFTAAVFVATAIGARFYFNWNDETSAPQFAGGFFVLLLMTYMLSSAYLLGAHMTRIYEDRIDAGDG
jgi:membrane protein